MDVLRFSGDIINHVFDRRINILGGYKDIGILSGNGKTKFFKLKRYLNVNCTDLCERKNKQHRQNFYLCRP